MKEGRWEVLIFPYNADDPIEVKATATNDNGITISATSAATGAVSDAAPTITTPTISGTVQEGQTLTAAASAGQGDNPATPGTAPFAEIVDFCAWRDFARCRCKGECGVDFCVMYRIEGFRKRDPQLRWELPDPVFFACGACHILSYAFLERYDVPSIQAHAQRFPELAQALVREKASVIVSSGDAAYTRDIQEDISSIWVCVHKEALVPPPSDEGPA